MSIKTNQFRENYASAPAPRPVSTVKDVLLAMAIGTGLAFALVKWWSV